MASNISALQQSVQGDVITSTHTEYDTAIARWAPNAQRKAAVVVFVKNPQDVGKALKYAKENGLKVAVRGGGHSAGGASSVEDGLVVDLSRYLNEVKIDAEKKLAYVGGGAIWETVDKAAIEHGLATIGGTINHTGVGGLILGGGFGWLSGSHGMAVDNLEQVTIVTANGTVLTANAKENSDIFWAIRGGGGNFGVVTEFVLRLHPQRRTVFAGPIIFPYPKLEAVIGLTQEWQAKGQKEQEAIVQATTRLDGNAVIICVLFYNGSEEEGRANFKAFYDLEPAVDGAKEIPYEQLNTLSNPFCEHGTMTYMKGHIQRSPSPKLAKEAFDYILAANSAEENKDMLIFVFYEYFSLKKINSVGDQDTAFPRQISSQGLVYIRWEGEIPGRVDYARKVAYDVRDIVSRENTTLNQTQNFGYANYSSETDQEVEGGKIADQPSRELFGVNYPKLQVLKKKYDPDLVFSKWYAIVPAA